MKVKPATTNTERVRCDRCYGHCDQGEAKRGPRSQGGGWRCIDRARCDAVNAAGRSALRYFSRRMGRRW